MTTDWKAMTWERMEEQARKMVAALDDDVSEEETIFIAAFIATGAVLATAKTNRQIKAGPDMFANLMRELLKGQEVVA